MRRLLVVAVALLSAHVAQAQAPTCAAPVNTLSYACGSACADAYTPCWLNTTASTAICTYQCYNKIYDTLGNFILLVPYGEWKSEVQLAYEATEMPTPVPYRSSADMIVGDTANYSWTSNDNLKKIDTLSVRKGTTNVYLMGGSYIGTRFWKGQVSNVELAADLLAAQTQVTLVLLRNLNLAPYTRTLAAMLPSSLVHVAINNALLTEFPTGFSRFLYLRRMYLNYNFIPKVDETMGFAGLQELELVSNKVASFDAVFKDLVVLGLSVNELTEVPAVVSKHSLLQQLWLNNNSLTAFPSSLSLPKLKTLYLTFNRIASFNTSFPNLEFLDLGYNELTEIPPIVFQFRKLTGLKLDGNNLQNVTLTNTQATFLASLKNFTIDDTALNTACYVSQQRDVRGYKFCIDDAMGQRVSGDATTDSDSTSSTSSSTVPIILGVVGGIVLVALIGFAVYRCHRSRSSGKRKRTNTTTNGGDATQSSRTTTIYTGAIAAAASSSLWNDPMLLSIKVDSEDIEDIERIGKGAFADVWLVKYRKTQLLASKRLRTTNDPARTQQFIAEIKLVATLDHPKIVHFVAIAWTLEADLQALFEYMDGGDLRSLLERDETPRLWTAQKLGIAIDVVEALVYVHSFNPPLVHRDLKSRNVLLSRQGEAKLTDFGVSRFRSEDNTMTAGVGTGRWLAPEVIAGNSDYGPAADIFSFGVVLSELDTHHLPYDDVVGPNGNKLADVALLQLIATGQLQPRFSGTSPDTIVELANRCFVLEPRDRPTATELAYALRTFQRDVVGSF